jgi:hypothetical protein
MSLTLRTHTAIRACKRLIASFHPRRAIVLAKAPRVATIVMLPAPNSVAAIGAHLSVIGSVRSIGSVPHLVGESRELARL